MFFQMYFVGSTIVTLCMALKKKKINKYNLRGLDFEGLDPEKFQGYFIG
jgi:hypothetical protein